MINQKGLAISMRLNFFWIASLSDFFAKAGITSNQMLAKLFIFLESINTALDGSTNHFKVG